MGNSPNGIVISYSGVLSHRQTVGMDLAILHGVEQKLPNIRHSMSLSMNFSSVVQLCLTLQLHRLQHTRLPCLSPTPGVCSNSCPFAEKAIATHSSTLAWQIPWTEEPGRLRSMGSLGVGHDEATSLSLFTVMHWRRQWQPTPVFLPGESQGWGSLVGCCLWGHTESDTTEAT